MCFIEGVLAIETFKKTSEAGEVGKEGAKTCEGSEILPTHKVTN